jgi:hypothetical protein
MRRCIRRALIVTMWIALASAPAFATGNGWNRGGDDSDQQSWQHDDSDSDHQPTSTKKKKKHDNGGPAVPEPTGALVFAAGLLAVRRATRRR